MKLGNPKCSTLSSLLCFLNPCKVSTLTCLKVLPTLLMRSLTWRIWLTSCVAQLDLLSLPIWGYHWVLDTNQLGLGWYCGKVRKTINFLAAIISHKGQGKLINGVLDSLSTYFMPLFPCQLMCKIS